VRISTINGKPAESSASQMGIRVLPRNEYDTVPSIVENRMQLDNLRQYNISFAQNSNRLTAYRGSATTIAIPWGVSRINDSVFNNKGLISVILPSSILVIGESSFQGNRLTSVIIPDSVTSIGRYAFNNNLLTSVYIGDSVTEIDYEAFRYNENLRSVTISANIRLGYNSLPYNLDDFYRNNSRRAGTYTANSDQYNNTTWRYNPRR